MTDPAELLDLARSTGLAAAELVRSLRAPGRVDAVATKSSPTDVVTAIDRASEELIRQTVLRERPDDAFLGEEGDDVDGSSGVRWIVDPIDGTVNFMYGIPGYAVSIAAEVDGEVAAGYVVDIAQRREYGAVLGAGAWRWGADDERIALHGPPAAPVSQLLVATGFGYAAQRRAKQGAAIARLLPQVRDIRRMGSAALDLVALAEGRVDAYLEEGLHPWDMAAGGLIAREAGLVVEGLAGGSADERMTMAAHPAVAEEFFALARACGF